MQYDRYGRRGYIRRGTSAPRRAGASVTGRTPTRAAGDEGRARRSEAVMRVLETSIVMLGVMVAFMWVILAHTTPEEQARRHDSIGESTHIAWR